MKTPEKFRPTPGLGFDDAVAEVLNWIDTKRADAARRELTKVIVRAGNAFDPDMWDAAVAETDEEYTIVRAQIEQYLRRGAE